MVEGIWHAVFKMPAAAWLGTQRLFYLRKKSLMKALRKIIKGVRLIFLRPKGFFDYCLNIFCAIDKK